jgi:predicted 2-oxoglutarate/Fe(II)-dependent dioxygenase YbiX
MINHDKLTIDLGNSVENIKVINNFIPKEHIDLLSVYGKCFAYYKKNNSWPEGILLPESVKELVLEYEDKMILLAENLYNRKFEKDRFMDFSYRHEGTSVKKHSDNVRPEIYSARNIDTSNLMWSGHLSIIGYLNDNFSGGEIHFPEQDFEYSPKAGDLIMFPGTAFYPHEVKEFHGGSRITMSIWTRFADFTGEV